MKNLIYHITLFTKIGTALLLLMLNMTSLNAQILINEFAASNSNTIADPEFNNYSDWIELHNIDSQAWNLKNFYLTDNMNDPNKWQITMDVILEPNEFIIIWADGKNTGLHTSYKISAIGEEIALYSPGSRLIDSISFGNQESDVSFGRLPEDKSTWAFFSEPSPGTANSTNAFSDIVFNTPEFSKRGGFYSGGQSISIKTDFGGVIRYTVDGSEPQSTSPSYTLPIEISETTILRARLFKEGEVPGPTVTQSYFINENSVEEALPLVSISTDPANFWDPEKGIYVQDFKPTWEIPVNIELFENNGMDRASFNQMAGVKINGLYSWQLPQKMLGVYFKKAYGSGNLEYPITPQRSRSSYKSFALRASGSDWSYSLFRDILGQHATLLNMNLDIMGFKPAVVYVNGEYLGIHNIREKVDADYIEQSYNLEPGSFDLIENQNYPEAGDLAAMNILLDLLNQDLSISANYDAVAALIDIENITDMIITEMAVRNTSISHNTMSWKPKDGGKWKWVVMDLDRGFFTPGSNLMSFYLSQKKLLFGTLFQNENYKEYFASRLSAQMFTSFNEQRMLELIDEHAQTIEKEIPNHIQRWKGTTSSYGNAMLSESYWRNHVCKIKTFVKARPTALLSDLQNYGFSGIAQLTLSSYPAAAGNIKIDGLKVPKSFCSSPYLKDIQIQITAENKPGYTFEGWYDLQQNWILNYGASWKYLDTGVNMDSEWRELYYDDANWKNGPAELGYGDDDEATVLSYGGSSSSKYITSYFRKKIPVSESQIQDGEFFIHLLVDDGAVVYINGTEVIRQNLDCGTVNYQTLAYKSVSGDAEESFTSYCINKELLVAGENQLAVEVHQVDESSSDISFNLGVSYFSNKEKTLYSLENKTGFTLTSDRYLSAIYSTENTCMVPSLINDEVTLSIDCSPYLVNEDIIIASSGILNIDPGVEIWMPEDGNIFVKGQLNSMGTENSPVSFRINPQYNSWNWGGIVFSNTNQSSNLRYTIIEDASNGPNPLLENAAISCFNANLNMDYLTIEKVAGNPIIARYSDITLSNSTLHSEITGDLINVKYGNAEITNCRFTGNEQVDTDAIDFDEVENGVIRNSVITGFYGFNSDAIDLGEEASGILIDSIFVYNITDKGVSLGQHSSASIKNSVFINCNMGIGVKDSSNVMVENCLFYNNGNAIACFEKNIGSAGGNANVKNSILSNSYLDSYFADLESKLTITYSLSDNLALPDGYNNINANPLFTGPSIFNFSLLAGSPAIQSGNNSLGSVDMATLPLTNDLPPPVMISKFFINANAIQSPEFITLYNPSEEKIDVSGYSINRGVTVTIPQDIFIFPKSSIYLTDDANHIFWEGRKTPVIQWTSGQLSNNGEAIQLSDSYGIVIDLIEYSIGLGWPLNGFVSEEAFVLEHTELDNHFPQNWTSVKLADALSSKAHSVESDIHVYPNPSAGIIHIKTENTQPSELFVYDYTGVLRGKWDMNNSGLTTLDISAYGPGVYILKTNAFTKRIILF